MHELLSLFVVSLQQAALYGILTLGLVLSFRIVRFPDLTVDGSFSVGAAIAGASIYYFNSPWLGTGAAFLSGALSGLATGALSIWLKINRLLAGILVMTMLYTVSLRSMGRGNLPLSDNPTVFSWVENFEMQQVRLTLLLMVLAGALYLIVWFLLETEMGLHLRVTGENPHLITSLGKNVNFYVLVGLALANGLVALSGALVAQHLGFSDVNMGIGAIVIGLACLYLGESLKLSGSVRGLLVGAVVGSLLYHVIKNAALRMGLQATDLKLVTAMLVVIALSLRPLGRGPAVADRPL